MHTMMEYPLTLAPLLERAGKSFGGAEIASRLPDRSWRRYDYREFRRRSLALAECLLAAGIKKHERVATLMWNHYAHFETYFGVPLSGGILHPLNLRLHPNEIAFIVNHAQDRFLIVDDVLLPVLEKFREQVRFERIFVVRHSGPLPPGMEDYDEWLKQATGNVTLPALAENDGASMCYTSGTTGNPKGVIYAHRTVVLQSMAAAMVDTTAICRRDNILVASSMFHVNGWCLPYVAALVGAKLVLPGPLLDAESVLNILEDEKITIACGVPTIWMAVVEMLEKHPGRWKRAHDIRVMCGGSAAPEFLIRALDRHRIRLIHAWGMTETAPTATVSRLQPEMDNWPEDRKYAVRAKQGWPLPFVELRIMTPAGEAPHDGQAVGELECRGAWIAGSYYNAPGTDDRWSPDGWFRTGDMAAIDPDGCIRIADRSKDMIKSGGEWISSVDLENALISHPAVREAAVVAIHHPKWQERPLAVVVLRDHEKSSPEELRSFLGERFAKWQLPDDVVFVNQLPHTSTGKLLKAELRKQYATWKWSGV
ncbi:MAG TPA: long-chain fatty acid--CoA ligase [Candidatus Saccharimonadales bacterium]|jgi:fatty-acyl-CoA synthase|nr:long-chain fatty acid--CoA ligase [Candidatus Saccharimonadales bacterium]